MSRAVACLAIAREKEILKNLQFFHESLRWCHWIPDLSHQGFWFTKDGVSKIVSFSSTVHNSKWIKIPGKIEILFKILSFWNRKKSMKHEKLELSLQPSNNFRSPLLCKPKVFPVRLLQEALAGGAARKMRDQRVQLTRVSRLRMQYLEEDPNITRNLACQRSRLPAMYLEFYPRVRHDIVA